MRSGCSISRSRASDRYLRTIDDWRPDVVAFSCNYLANIPEIVDLAKETKRRWPDIFVFVGGHSVSFTAAGILEHAEGAIDCVLKGEGEASVADLLLAAEHDRAGVLRIPGVVARDGEGPRPRFVESLDDVWPARDLLRHRRKYFIGVLDPCASIEFSRGCPWDCSFCSAWTFYGRSYRTVSPERAVEDLARIREPGVFIVDDVAFIQDRHGLAIGEAIARNGIKKNYYLETRGDVLLRNKEVFRFWKDLGVEYMFLGLEAIDEEGLKKYRKRVPLGTQFRGAGVRPLARHHGGDQHHRRSGLGRGALPGGARVVPGGAGDRQHQRQHALSRHRELAERGAQARDARLPAVRHPARGPADPAAARSLLSRAGRDAAGAQHEAPRLRAGSGKPAGASLGFCSAARPTS